MAKFKLAKRKSKSGAAARKFRAVPCIVFMAILLGLLLLLFYGVLKGAYAG
jgi:hypothetical protein